MLGFSFGDVLFILVVCFVIWAVLSLVKRKPEPARQKTMILDDENVREILRGKKLIAMVGASSNPERPSNHVLEYLLNAGYVVYPVNPKDEQLFGQKVYRSLHDIPVPVDIVDVFRNSDQAPEVALEAVAIGAKVLWMQEGVVSEEAREIALKAGLQVVMNRCMLKEHRRLGF